MRGSGLYFITTIILSNINLLFLSQPFPFSFRSRKEEELDASKQRQLALQEIADQMELSLREVASEQATLHSENLHAPKQLGPSHTPTPASCTTACTPRGETHAILAELGTTPEGVEVGLRERGLGVVDLYAQVMKREKENERLRQAKRAVET